MNDFLRGMINTFKYTDEFETQRLMSSDGIQGSFDFYNTMFYKLGLRRLDVLLDEYGNLLKSDLYADIKILSHPIKKEIEIFDGFEVSHLTIISNDENKKDLTIDLFKKASFYSFKPGCGIEDVHFFLSDDAYRGEDIDKIKEFSKYISDKNLSLAVMYQSDDDVKLLKYLSTSSKVSNLYIYIDITENEKQNYTYNLNKKLDVLSSLGLNTSNNALFLYYDDMNKNMVDFSEMRLQKDLIFTLSEICEDYYDVFVVASSKLKNYFNYNK